MKTKKEPKEMDRTKLDVDAYPKFYQDSRDKAIIFILGVQGSGTNFISNILRKIFNHSVIQDRSLIFNEALKLKSNNNQYTPDRAFKQIYSKFFPDPLSKKFQLKHYHHRADHYKGIQEYFPKLQIQSGEDLVYFFYTYHAFTEGKENIAVKSDDLWENLRDMHRVIENRKYIFLTRDCRDNVLSISRKNFGPRQVYVASNYVKERIRAYYDEVSRFPEISLSIAYEDLLVDPRKVVQTIAEKFQLQPVENIEAELEKLNIKSTNFDKWKRLMSPRELLICESILREELTNLGYQLKNREFTTFSGKEIAQYKFLDAIKCIPQKVKRLYRNFFKD